MREPLYDTATKNGYEPKVISTLHPEKSISDEDIRELAKKWNGYGKKLIFCGMLDKNDKLNQLLEIFAEDPSVVVLTESTSNLHSPHFNHCVDRLITSVKTDEIEGFKPNLLITFGSHIISKKIKEFFRTNRPVEHWSVHTEETHVDTYRSLTTNIPVKPETFLSQLDPFAEHQESEFRVTWKQRDYITQDKHWNYINNCEFSDLKTYSLVLDCVPEHANLQMGNSAAVRYIQLFDPIKSFVYNSNRGTSGIDGSTSTAAGAAYINERPTTLICGDVSFLYDSNALWNQNLKGNLTIIIINNQGGGIFRFIDGPADTPELEKYFEAHHQTNAEHLANSHDLYYLSAGSYDELEQKLVELYQLESDKPAILEVFTPREKNDLVLKDYFQHIKSI